MLGRLILGLAVAVGGLIGIAVVMLVVLKATGVLNLYRIPSSSMEPTLHCGRPGIGCEAGSGDRVVSLRYVLGAPGRGDLVAFHTPPIAAERCGTGGVFIKRIVGLPGDRVSERDGWFYVDGRKLDDSAYVPADERDFRTIAPVQVPPDAYFLVGDNRSSSCDSRSWGTATRKSLIGKIVGTYWPPRRIALR